MNPPDTILEVREVTKQFAGFTAVSGMSLALRRGERRGLIGPNGAGKTTLFNLISGRLRADSGEIRYLGQPIHRLPAHRICRLGLARTFQITSIYHRLTCLQNVQVALFARYRRSHRLFGSARFTDVEEALGFLGEVGLERQPGRVAGQLSYGDQKRLELALALAAKPQVLLLDEPTAGMEAGARRGIVDLVQRLCAEHALTLLFCEHDMDSVFRLADSITVAHEGRILFEGSAEDVIANEEVRAIYLGSRRTARP